MHIHSDTFACCQYINAHDVLGTSKQRCPIHHLQDVLLSALLHSNNAFSVNDLNSLNEVEMN